MSGTTRNLFAYLPASPIIVGTMPDGTQNGECRIEWRHFFAQLWTRTGGTTSGPPLAGDAPSDGNIYARMNASWVEVLPAGQTGISWG